MTGPQYRAVRNRAYLVARAALQAERIDDAIAMAENALAIGPVCDPTLYRSEAQAAREDVELMRAVERFRADLERIGAGTIGAPA